jgi:hypothetical protein
VPAENPPAETETANEPTPPPKYDGWKQPQYKAELDKRGIEYKKGPVRNDDLLALLEADDAAKAAAGS